MTAGRWTAPVQTGYLYWLRIMYAYHDLGAWA
jgi:hypothetical protein